MNLVDTIPIEVFLKWLAQDGYAVVLSIYLILRIEKKLDLILAAVSD